MVLAVAALVLQMGSAVQAVPAAAASSASATASAAAMPAPAPAAATASLPDAPLPSNRTEAPSVSTPPVNSSRSEAAEHSSPILRADASNTPPGNTDLLSAIRVSPTDSKPIEHVSAEHIPSRKTWLALTIASSSAATFDAYATRRAIQAGANEQDPFMKPFANSNGLYAAIQICPLVLDYAARRMQRSESPVLRHSWWLPQTVSTGVYLFAGAHNLSISRH